MFETFTHRFKLITIIMFKRIVYLTFSSLTTIGTVCISFNIPGVPPLFGFLFTPLILFTFYAISVFTSFIYEDFEDEYIGGVPAYTFLIGIMTLFHKKIYYSDLGYFWVRLYKNEVYIYEQDYFIFKEIGVVMYSGTLDNLSKLTKYYDWCR